MQPATMSDTAADETQAGRGRRFFAEHLRRLLAARGWTQSELGRRAGVGRDVVSTYMTERSLPTRANLERIAKALDMLPADLLPPSDVEGAEVYPFSALSLPNGLARVRLDMVLTLDELTNLMVLINGTGRSPGGDG